MSRTSSLSMVWRTTSHEGDIGHVVRWKVSDEEGRGKGAPGASRAPPWQPSRKRAVRASKSRHAASMFGCLIDVALQEPRPTARPIGKKNHPPCLSISRSILWKEIRKMAPRRARFPHGTRWHADRCEMVSGSVSYSRCSYLCLGAATDSTGCQSRSGLRQRMPAQKNVVLRHSGHSPVRLTRAGDAEPPFLAGLARPSHEGRAEARYVGQRLFSLIQRRPLRGASARGRSG